MSRPSSEGRALLAAYREVSEFEDRPRAAVLERIEASTEPAVVRRQPRRAAALLIMSVATASAVTTALAWSRPELRPLPSRAPVSEAVERGEEALPRSPASTRAPQPTMPVEEPPPPNPVEIQIASPPRVPSAPRRPDVVAETPADDGLARELELLRATRVALRRGAYSKAAAALRQHGDTFPSGQLAEDREALWVMLRCGRDDTNTGRAAFEAAHPSSHHLAAIRAACEER